MRGGFCSGTPQAARMLVRKASMSDRSPSASRRSAADAVRTSLAAAPASVEAVENVTVLVLDKNTLDEGLGMGGWTGSLVRALAQRFRDLEQQVRDAGIKRG